MQLLTFVANDQERVGVVVGNRILDLREAWRRFFGSSDELDEERRPIYLEDMLSFIRGEESSLDLARELVARAKGNAMPPRPAIGNSWWYDLADVTVLAPIPRPLKNVFCLGRNYREHAAEGARARGEAVVYPQDPVFFTKPPTAVVGPDAPITFQRTVTSQVDYEVELGVVIGKTGANIPRQDAWDHVFGYTIVNDVSARDLQTRHNQWFKGKGLDTFCPMGPYLVSRDELPEVKSLELRLRVNGELRQQARIDEMIFDISAIIEILSAGLTLEPGDVIATGTPQGVGFAMIPPRFLCAGDLVECEIEGIGILRNPVRER